MSKVTHQLAEGELVNVQIKGARVAEIDHALDGSPIVELVTSHVLRLSLAMSGVTVERVAPAEWPPQLGDIWSDRDEREWVAGATDGETIVMWRIGDGRGGVDALDVLYDHGPLRLVRRRGWTPTTDAAPAASEPEQADERAQYIAGLHELAYWLTANPDVHLPYLGFGGSIELQQQRVEAVPIFAGTYGDDPRSEMLAVEQAMGDAAVRRVERDQALVWRRFGGIALVASAKVDEVGAGWAPFPAAPDTRLSLDEALADAFPGPKATDCDDACEDERVAAGTCRHTDGW